VDTLVCFGARLDEVCVCVVCVCLCACECACVCGTVLCCAVLCCAVLCCVCVCHYNYNDYCNHSILSISLDTIELNVRMF
jgi:hypothetical protein